MGFSPPLGRPGGYNSLIYILHYTKHIPAEHKTWATVSRPSQGVIHAGDKCGLASWVTWREEVNLCGKLVR